VVSPDQTLLYLANVLVKCFSPFQGAPADVIPNDIASQVPLKGQTSAFESNLLDHASMFSLLTLCFNDKVAIVTQAKLFICTSS